MAEGIKRPTTKVRTTLPRAGSLGTAAVSARQRFAWVWSRESATRLGLSLVLAAALWLYITGKENPTVADYNQPIPVTTANVGTGLTVTNRIPSVHLQIRVNNGNVLVTPSSFHMFVNLFGVGPGRHPSVPVQVVSDPGIIVVKIIPSHVPIMIEQKIEKSVHVIAQTLSAPPEGYTVGTPILTPSLIRVSGPRSLMEQVTEASVTVDLSGIRTSLEGPQKPLLLDSQGIAVSASDSLVVSPPLVNVVVPVRQLNSFKTVPLLVPIRGQPKAGFGVSGITVTPSEITATGLPSLLGHLSTVSTAPVSVTRHAGGVITRRVSLRLPRGVHSLSHVVTVRVQLAPVEASTSIEVGVAPEGVPTGLVAHTTPAYVLVTVIGPSSRLSSAGRSMRAVIDMSNYGAGTYSVTPTITRPPGLAVGGVYPQQIAVVLQPAPTR